MFYGTPVVSAQPVGRTPSLLPQQKITDDFLSYIHTTSPSVVIDLVNASQMKSKGVYSFESYVLDLSGTAINKAKTWVLGSLRETKLLSPSADLAVVNITDPSSIKPVKKTPGRKPALASTPLTPKILVAEIARLAGVKLQDRLVNSTSPGSTATNTAPAGVVLIERINGAPVNWMFFETHGLGIERSLALANTVGSLSGLIQFSGSGYNQFSLNSAFTRGYAQLILENQRISQDFVARPTYAPAQPKEMEHTPQTSPANVRFLRTVTARAALVQLPHIVSWLSSVAPTSSTDVQSIAFSYFTAGVEKSWKVALETSLEHRRRFTPEQEDRIRQLESRQRLSFFIGEKVFGQLVGSQFGNGPEAWFIFTIAGAAAVAKIYYDHQRLARTINEINEAQQQLASVPPPSRPMVPMTCKETLGTASNPRVAGL